MNVRMLDRCFSTAMGLRRPFSLPGTVTATLVLLLSTTTWFARPAIAGASEPEHHEQTHPRGSIRHTIDSARAYLKYAGHTFHELSPRKTEASRRWAKAHPELIERAKGSTGATDNARDSAGAQLSADLDQGLKRVATEAWLAKHVGMQFALGGAVATAIQPLLGAAFVKTTSVLGFAVTSLMAVVPAIQGLWLKQSKAEGRGGDLVARYNNIIWLVAGSSAVAALGSAMLPAGATYAAMMTLAGAMTLAGGAAWWYGARLDSAATRARAILLADPQALGGEHEQLRAWATGLATPNARAE